MSIKVDNIIKHYEAKRRVIVKMDKASGYSSITITKGSRHTNIVGTIPGGKLVNATMADVRAMLETNSIYINSWS